MGPARKGWAARLGRHKWPVLVLATLMLLGGVLVAQAQTPSPSKFPLQPPAQPVAFSHKVHVEKGISCLFCHSNAPRGQVASIPSVEKCMGCHRVIKGSTPQAQAEIAKVRDAWERHVPLRWEKKTDLPDFVYFSHRPHIQAGIPCKRCHGDVGNMTMPPRNFGLTMGFCLSCHRQQAPEKVAKLVDCATCHK